MLVFYPADFTCVCPTELGDQADHYTPFKALGVAVYGVSWRAQPLDAQPGAAGNSGLIGVNPAAPASGHDLG